MKRILGCAVAAIVMLIVTPSSKGSTIFYFTQEACSGGGCGIAPFGSVTLDQFNANTVSVTVTLAANERFAGTGAGEALEFNLSPSVGTPVIISSFDPSVGFAVGPAPATASAFGSFQYSVTCTSCQGGNANNPAGPLSFLVSTSSGVNVNDFVANSRGYYFASDIVGNNGPNTGNVGAPGGTTATPEPVSSALVGAGLLGIGFLGRRRTSKSS